MTEWTPPRESGLKGDRYVEDDLTALLGTDDMEEAHRPGVYSLKLSTPDDWQAVKACWRQAYDKEMPAWVREAYESSTVLYVGGAKNVHHRLHEHANGSRAPAIEAVFPPHSVWDVWFFDSADEAFTRESQIATRLHGRHGMWVHQQ